MRITEIDKFNIKTGTFKMLSIPIENTEGLIYTDDKPWFENVWYAVKKEQRHLIKEILSEDFHLYKPNDLVTVKERFNDDEKVVEFCEINEKIMKNKRILPPVPPQDRERLNEGFDITKTWIYRIINKFRNGNK